MASNQELDSNTTILLLKELLVGMYGLTKDYQGLREFPKSTKQLFVENAQDLNNTLQNTDFSLDNFTTAVRDMLKEAGDLDGAGSVIVFILFNFINTFKFRNHPKQS
jgi:hypothetical protein